MKKLILILVLFPSVAWGTTYTLGDCAQTTVQTAINNATDGDIIKCPAGTWTWTTPSAGNPSISISKSITLVGAGYDIVNGMATSQTTTIVNATTFSYNESEGIMKVTGAVGRTVRITGFTETGSEGEAGIYVIGTKYWNGFRLDHCTFNNSGNVVKFQSTFGLIDHCTFNQNGGSDLSIRADGDGTYLADDATSFFVQPLPLGTSNAIYVEACTFNSSATDGASGFADCEKGGQYVFRYNTFNKAGVTTHETGYSGFRGCRYMEIYNNQWNIVSPAWLNAGVNVRGGTGLFFNNSWSSNRFNSKVAFNDYRSTDTFNQGYEGSWGRCNGLDNCDGNDPNQHPASNGSVPSGYPCLDQIGRQVDQNWNGPLCSNSQYNPYASQNLPGPGQYLDPAYGWNNKVSGSVTTVFSPPSGCLTNPNGVSICGSDHVKVNREYFDYVASFNGTVGTGVGTLTQRPTTCSPNTYVETNGHVNPGVGYFATDVGANGTFYRCTATNTWTAYYTQYTCPYPGWGIAGSCNSAVSGLSGYPADVVGISKPYTTTFPATENPISENGFWINGGTVGLDWGNVRTTTNLAYGTNTVANYSDPTAILSGTWAANQYIQGTVHSGGNPGAAYPEVELRLRSAISAHSNTGYEVLYSVRGNYAAIVKWNGALGNYTGLVDCTNNYACGVTENDVVKAEIVGNRINAYKNGNLLMTTTDGTFTSGNPGIGFDYGNNSTDFGFKTITAGEINDYTVTASVNYHGTPYGTIDGQTTVSKVVSAGSSTTFNIQPSLGSHVYSVSTSGCVGTPPVPLISGGTYTVGPVNATCSLTAIFGQQVTGAVDGCQSISCPSLVPSGEPATCTATPGGGKHTSGFTGGGGSWVSGNSYTTGNLVSDTTVTATCAANTWSVTSSSGSNVSVNPLQVTPVAEGGYANFTIIPSAGYYVSISTTCAGYSISGTTYTFGPVTANCSFIASALPLSVGGGGKGGVKSKNGKIKVSNGYLKAR